MGNAKDGIERTIWKKNKDGGLGHPIYETFYTVTSRQCGMN